MAQILWVSSFVPPGDQKASCFNGRRWFYQLQAGYLPALKLHMKRGSVIQFASACESVDVCCSQVDTNISSPKFSTFHDLNFIILFDIIRLSDWLRMIITFLTCWNVPKCSITFNNFLNSCVYNKNRLIIRSFNKLLPAVSIILNMEFHVVNLSYLKTFFPRRALII